MRRQGLVGINLGAFIGPPIAGALAQRVDWHLGFACDHLAKSDQLRMLTRRKGGPGAGPQNSTRGAG